jgi:hypothetical protein
MLIQCHNYRIHVHTTTRDIEHHTHNHNQSPIARPMIATGLSYLAVSSVASMLSLRTVATTGLWGWGFLMCCLSTAIGGIAYLYNVFSADKVSMFAM